MTLGGKDDRRSYPDGAGEASLRLSPSPLRTDTPSPWSTNASYIPTMFFDTRNQKIPTEGSYVSSAFEVLHPRLRAQRCLEECPLRPSRRVRAASCRNQRDETI